MKALIQSLNLQTMPIVQNCIVILYICIYKYEIFQLLKLHCGSILAWSHRLDQGGGNENSNPPITQLVPLTTSPQPQVLSKIYLIHINCGVVERSLLCTSRHLYPSYHLGNSWSFGSSVPETGEEDQIYISSYKPQYHNSLGPSFSKVCSQNTRHTECSVKNKKEVDFKTYHNINNI